MIFEEKQIKLKDGRTAVLKAPTIEDAEKLLAYAQATAGETEFLVRCPEEWNITVEQEAAWIHHLRSSPDALGIACYIDGIIAGNCDLRLNARIKTVHRAGIGIAILKEYWNLGIGSAMFMELISAAREHGTEILELSFIEGNHRGRALYEKFGFCTVAEIPKAFRQKDGRYCAEIYMHKYL